MPARKLDGSRSRCTHHQCRHKHQCRFGAHAFTQYASHKCRARVRARAEAPATSEAELKAKAVEAGPSVSDGRMTYNAASYNDLVRDAANAVIRGVDDGLACMEVEFPPIMGLDSYKGDSDAYIDANAQLAIRAGLQIHEQTGKNVVVLLPDSGELKRSAELFKSSLELYEGVTLSHLFEGREPLKKRLSQLFGMDAKQAAPAAAAEADVHLVINITSNELPDVRQYQQEVVKDGSSLCFWNCELDTLRGDLGMFGFPSKSLQYDFLSRCKPVFYLRQRDYSKTVSIAPFIVNYSGCLFREYPGPWQVMLRQDTGEYACISEDRSRYTLGEVKAELLEAMGLDTEKEGSSMQFLRRGYKTTTWWEDDEGQEESDAWRT